MQSKEEPAVIANLPESDGSISVTSEQRATVGNAASAATMKDVKMSRPNHLTQ